MGRSTDLNKIYGFPVNLDDDTENIKSFLSTLPKDERNADSGSDPASDLKGWTFEDSNSFSYEYCGEAGYETSIIIGVKSEYVGNPYDVFLLSEISENPTTITPTTITDDDERAVQEMYDAMGYGDDGPEIGWYLCVSTI